MRRTAAAVILIISLLVSGLAIAGPFEDAENSYDRGDYETAYRLYKSLAERGSPVAQSNLGLMYYNSLGVPQDYAEAAKWYRKAADQGDMSAQYILGRMYNNGRGVPRDYAEAVQWYRKAADQGHADAQNNLGLMYILGQGVQQDYVFAHMWLNLAATRLPASERWMVEKKINIIASMMTPAQIAEAQKLAREWKPKNER